MRGGRRREEGKRELRLVQGGNVECGQDISQRTTKNSNSSKTRWHAGVPEPGPPYTKDKLTHKEA